MYQVCMCVFVCMHLYDHAILLQTLCVCIIYNGGPSGVWNHGKELMRPGKSRDFSFAQTGMNSVVCNVLFGIVTSHKLFIFT